MEQHIVGEYVLENSKSRSGKHKLSTILYIYDREKGLTSVAKALDIIVEKKSVKPTYSRGEAYAVKLKLGKGDYVIYGWFVKNFLGKVKGYISIYSYKGELVYRAKYYDGVLRRSVGNPVNAWLVRLFIDKTKIPVKETYLGDEYG